LKHRTNECRECTSIRNRAAKFSLTVKEVMDLLSRPCEACGDVVSGKNQHIDHCHDSDKVRGVLCGNCNVSLGIMGEDPARLRALAEYIERHL
jgi:hypothetical protein